MRSKIGMGEVQQPNRATDQTLGGKAFSAKHRVSTALTYRHGYRCPACGSGDLNPMAMMDVFACDFCRHMFTANLQTQSVQLADSLQPMAWHWTGQRWKAAYQSDSAAALVWTFAVGIVFIPVLLIAVSNYVFPPSGGLKFVMIWISLTWLSHSIIAGWLLAEYHRWPWYISSRVRLQRLTEQWQS
ncbi:MAG: hypothetical protein AAGM45_00180 [Cyanobacteria bacterium J06588_5]